MRIRDRAGALLALAAMFVAVPAEASCWRAEEAAAASIRDFQTMLMVSALRCRAAGLGSTAGYDVFVLANRTLLDATNATIRAHFTAEAATGAQDRYDRFTTLLANGYGASATTPRSCAAAAELMTIATAAAGSREAMLRVVATRAERVVEACAVPMAVAEAALPGLAEAPSVGSRGGPVRLALAVPD